MAEEADNSSGPLLPRRIEFHLATKPFLGFVKSSGARSDFKLTTLNPTAAVTEPSRPACDASVQRSEVPQFFENGFDPDPSFEITVRKIGAGLENLGNTCFLNSVLQCLTYTEPLVAYLQSSKHQISCRNFGFCALCAIQKHVSSARKSTGRILAPMDFVSNLRFISRKFRSSRQEDAHEYMVYLLESMHKCCFPSGVPIESPRSYEKSMVHKIFGGHLRSQVKCIQCSYYSNKFDPFLDLSLEITKADSLHKALLHFTAIEYIEYQCQQCGQNVKASKQFTIDKSPYVLTIHLKRFGCSDPGHKIDKKVNFGLTLDLKPFLGDSDEGDQKYTLYGVLVHDGWSTHSGHYFCFVRTSSGMWYYLDDNRVIQVSEKAVLNQKAYMLFYVRDRKKITPEQPVCVKKESFASSFMGQKAFPSSTLAVKVQNNSNGKEVNGSASSAAAKINAPNVGSPFQNFNEPEMAESVNESSLNELDPVSGHSTLKPNFNGSGNLVNAPAIINVRMKGFNENRTTHKDPCLPDLISAPCIECQPQSPITDKLAAEKISQKFNFSLKESAALDATGKKSGSSKVKSCLISRKSKKKLLKYGFASLRLGSSILLRRKHKRSKDLLLGTRDIYREHLVEGSLASADLGPSTSEITKATSLHSIHSKRHGLNSRSKGANGTTAEAGLTVNSGCSIHCFDEEVKRRTDERNPIPGGNKKPEKSACPILGSKHQVAGESSSLEGGRKVSTPNTLMGNFITLDLEDSSVARWDDAGSQLPSPILESSSADGMGAGYVLDEWDEEYDRGKRKKIRESKVVFGGPNPFQVVASKKARKLKNDGSAKLRK